MRVLYAVFPDKSAADRVVREVLKTPECGSEHCAVTKHPEDIDLASVFDSRGLALEETDALPGYVRGALLGAVAGAGLAVLLRWLLDMVQFGVWSTLVLGAAGGLVFGGLAAGLVGVGIADRQLRKLRRDLDQEAVLVTFSVSGESAEQAVQHALRRSRVRAVERKHVV